MERIRQQISYRLFSAGLFLDRANWLSQNEASRNQPGVGDIEDFDGKSFRFSVHGAADLKMDGRVEDLEINISGAGEADTRKLKAKNVEVRISGAGEAKVFADESLRGRISGVGSLTYWGDPEEKDTSVSGIGSIKHKK